MDYDYYDDPPVFFGQGSVNTFVSLRDPPAPKRRPIGFHIPRVRR